MQSLNGRSSSESSTASAQSKESRPEPGTDYSSVRFPGRETLAKAIAAAVFAAGSADRLPAEERPSGPLATSSAQAATDPLVGQIRSAIDQVLDGKISSLTQLTALIQQASPAARVELSSYLSGLMKHIEPGQTPDTVRFLVAAEIYDLLEPPKGSAIFNVSGERLEFDIKRIVATQAVSDPKNWKLTTIYGIDLLARGLQILGELRALGQDFDELKLLSHLRAMTGAFSRTEIGEYAADELNQLRRLQSESRQTLNDSLVAHLTGKVPASLGSAASASSSALEALKPHLEVGKDGTVTLARTDVGVWKVEPLADLDDPLSLLTLRHEGSSAYVSMPIEELAQLAKSPDTLTLRLQTVLAQSEKDSFREARDPLRRVDLPVGRTAFITVLPDKYDRVVSSQFVPSALLEAALIDKYGAACPPLLLLTEDPLSALRSAIQKAKQSNPKITDVFIQLHNHGSPSAIEFGSRVTGADLAKLAREFPGVKLHVMSTACFGGGVTAELERLSEGDPESVSGINFYAHTSSDLVALAGGRPVIGSNILNEDIISTPYFYEVIVRLTNHPEMALGAVFDQADHSSQSIFAVNPESFAGGVRVRGLEDDLPE